MYGSIVQAIVDNMNLDNVEQLKAELKQAAQPDPAEIQRAEEAHKMEMRAKIAQISVYEAQANESNARAKKYDVETELMPREVEIDKLEAVADVREKVNAAEFGRRLDVANTKLKEKDLNIKSKKVDLDIDNAKADREAQKELNGLIGG